jgi:hypothetical protein
MSETDWQIQQKRNHTVRYQIDNIEGLTQIFIDFACRCEHKPQTVTCAARVLSAANPIAVGKEARRAMRINRARLCAQMVMNDTRNLNASTSSASSDGASLYAEVVPAKPATMLITTGSASMRALTAEITK